MARTLENIVRDQLGQLMLEICSLSAQLEAAREAVPAKIEFPAGVELPEGVTLPKGE